MFCAVKRFKEEEGGGRDMKGNDKREVVLADGKPVLRFGKVDGQPKKNWKIESTREEVERDWLCVG